MATKVQLAKDIIAPEVNKASPQKGFHNEMSDFTQILKGSRSKEEPIVSVVKPKAENNPSFSNKSPKDKPTNSEKNIKQADTKLDRTAREVQTEQSDDFQVLSSSRSEFELAVVNDNKVSFTAEVFEKIEIIAEEQPELLDESRGELAAENFIPNQFVGIIGNKEKIVISNFANSDEFVELEEVDSEFFEEEQVEEKEQNDTSQPYVISVYSKAVESISLEENGFEHFMGVNKESVVSISDAKLDFESVSNNSFKNDNSIPIEFDAASLVQVSSKVGINNDTKLGNLLKLVEEGNLEISAEVKPLNNVMQNNLANNQQASFSSSEFVIRNLFSSSANILLADGQGEKISKAAEDFLVSIENMHNKLQSKEIAENEIIAIGSEQKLPDAAEKLFTETDNKFADAITGYGGEVLESQDKKEVIISFPDRLVKKADVTPQRSDQISLSVKYAVSEGKSQIRVNMYPQALGAIDVSIEFARGENGEQIVKSIKIFAENRSTLDILEKSQTELQKSLSEVVESKDASLQFDMKERQEDKKNSLLYSNSEEREKWMDKFTKIDENNSGHLGVGADLAYEQGQQGYVGLDAVDIKV